jgi:glycosyltransferase involved in cell wall biosynthesis
MLPLVSIVIPVYNAAKELPACLDSVLSQSYSNLQVILVNDGSRDNSLDICRQYVKKDSRILLLNQKNAGPGAARNAALKVVTGEYIQFVDSDDLLPEWAVEALVQAMQGNDLVIAHFQIGLPNGTLLERGLLEGSLRCDRQAFLKLLIKLPGSYYYSALWNKLYSRQLIECNHLRFEESFIWGEDCLFNMQYYALVDHVQYIPDVVYRYYRKVTGLSWGSVFNLHKGIRIKAHIYRALRALYVQNGLFPVYRWHVRRYIFNVTMMQ